MFGKDSLDMAPVERSNPPFSELQEVRLRLDGIFESKEIAQGLTEEFDALYTNGPAGGGGIRYLHSLVLLQLSNLSSLLQLANYHNVLSSVWLGVSNCTFYVID
jgi:hypothetical protein